jgi:oligopeptide transport system substrate-binding protein
MKIFNLLVTTMLLFSVSLSAEAAKKITLAKDQVLKLGNGSEPKELDPSRATGAPEGKILDSIFEGLVNLDQTTLEIIPGVAESWSVSKDGLTYTFKIRKNAKWSDGQALTANDFVYSWKRAVSPKLASEYAYQLYYIKNGEAINTGKIKDVNKLGVKAKDSHTLIVTLENPTPFFLQLCAFRTLYPVPKHIVTKFKDQEWTREENIVSNGAFKLTEWKINKHVIAVKNNNYWDANNVTLKKIFFYPIEKVETEENSFFSNQLHMTTTVPQIKISLYEKRAKRDPSKYNPYKNSPYLGTYFYRFNTTKKPFSDKRVRKAFSMVIDRSLLTSRIARGGELPATTFTPPGVGGYTYKDTYLQANTNKETIAKAKALLAEAGYKDLSKFPKTEILYNTSENHKKIAVAIQQMWKGFLGVNVGLYNQEWKVYLSNQSSLKFDISRSGWIGDYADPNTFLDMFVTGGGNNNTGWSNKRYDELIKLASAESNQEKRFKYFQEAEGILLDEMPVIPIYIYTNKKLVSEKVVIRDKAGKWSSWYGNVQDRFTLKQFGIAQ